VKEKNIEIVRDIEDKFKKANCVILTNFQGLSVNKMALLRKQLKQNNAEYRILKNTLLSIASKNLNLDSFLPQFLGPTAVVFGMGDEILICKTLTKFIKENEKLKIKIGLVSGKILSADDLRSISTIPSKEILLTKLAGILYSCTGSLVLVLNGPLQALINLLINLLHAKIKKDEGGKNC